MHRVHRPLHLKPSPISKHLCFLETIVENKLQTGAILDSSCPALTFVSETKPWPRPKFLIIGRTASTGEHSAQTHVLMMGCGKHVFWCNSDNKILWICRNGGFWGVGYEGRLGLGDVPSTVTEERRGRGAQRSDQSAVNRAGVATSQPAC